MSAVEMESVNFEYAAVPGAGVRDIDLTVEAGQIVVACGPSGSGKSTVTRILNGLIPNFFEGSLSGRVRVGGLDVSSVSVTEVAQVTGSVFQDPRTQFFTGDTISELAFGPENLGWDPARIQARIDALSASLALSPLLGRGILALSGGEQQRLACAVASMPDPEVLLLDEPSSTLDSTAVGSLTETLREWKSEGKAILVAEHRLDYLADIADQFVYFDRGRITARYSRDEFLALGPARWEELGLRSPLPSFMTPFRAPLGSGGARNGLRVHLGGARVRRGKRTVLDIADATLPLDQPLAIVGANGSGKSTLARWLAGLGGSKTGTMTIMRDDPASDTASKTTGTERTLRPRDRLNACYLVAQNTNNQLFSDTVLGEILLANNARRPAEKLSEDDARGILTSLDLDQMASRHPLTLSGGEKQRLVIAVALASRRRIVILDEPTSGLDAIHMRQVAAGIRTLHDAGAAVIVITHDVDLVELTCGCLVRLESGHIDIPSDIAL